MKKNLLLLLLFISSITHSQNTLTFDFTTKTITAFPTSDNLKPGNFLQIQVDNLPSDKYKISINKTDSFVKLSEPPALFQAGLSFGQDFSSLLTNLTSFSVRTAGVTKQTVAEETTKQNTSTFAAQQLFEGVDLFAESEPKNIKEEYNLDKALSDIVKLLHTHSVGVRQNPMIDLIQQHITFFSANAKTLLNLQYFYSNDAQIIAVLEELDQTVLLRTRANSILQQTIIPFKNSLITWHYDFKTNVLDIADNLILNYKENNIANCISFETQARNIITQRDLRVRQLEILFQGYIDATLPKADIILGDVALAKGDSIIQNYRKDFYNFLGKGFDSLFNFSTIAKACDQLNKLPITNRFTSFPFQIKDDITKWVISITPLDNTFQSYFFSYHLSLYLHYFFGFTS